MLYQIIGILSGIVSCITFYWVWKDKRRKVEHSTKEDPSIKITQRKTRIVNVVIAILSLFVCIYFLGRIYLTSCKDENIQLTMKPITASSDFISGQILSPDQININTYKIVVYFQYAGPDLYIHPGKHERAFLDSDGSWEIRKIASSTEPEIIYAFLVRKLSRTPETLNRDYLDRFKYCAHTISKLEK